MTRHLHIRHRTQYNYAGGVAYGLMQLRLRPVGSSGTVIDRWNLCVDGGTVQAEYVDQHGNLTTMVSTDADTQRLEIIAEGAVRVEQENGVFGPHDNFVPLWLYQQDTSLTRIGPRVRRLIKPVINNLGNDIVRAHEVSRLIREAVAWEYGVTTAETSAEAALGWGKGVCQDHAHIFCAAMRALGHPARYVSGYLMMNDVIDQDASHAWAEAHFEGIGWVGFDVSNGYSPDDRYLRLAVGCDYAEAAPVSGLRFGQQQENMIVELQVQQ